MEPVHLESKKGGVRSFLPPHKPDTIRQFCSTYVGCCWPLCKKFI